MNVERFDSKRVKGDIERVRLSLEEEQRIWMFMRVVGRPIISGDTDGVLRFPYHVLVEKPGSIPFSKLGSVTNIRTWYWSLVCNPYKSIGT